MKGFRPDPRLSDAAAQLTGHRAYDELRRRILRGEIAQGTVVNEVAFAESLGISRTPVREAFRELLNEGLLEGRGPRRQVTVRTIGVEHVREITGARRALEAMTTTAAAARITDAGIDDLRLIVQRMARAIRHKDLQSFLDADDEFHSAIASTAEMPTVEEFLARLRALTRLAAVPLAGWAGVDLPGLHGEVIDVLAKNTGLRARPLTALLARCTDVLTGSLS